MAQQYKEGTTMSLAQRVKSQANDKKSVPFLYTVTIFVSAALLFFVQPLFAKLALPQVGGSPAIWATAMLFFQAVLLAGYAYAHLLTKKLSVAKQVLIHLLLWVCALFFLPLALRTEVNPETGVPVALQTLMLFAAGVGIPFAFLSANAPLIQSWYAKSGGYSSDDPYFLYGASNLGSLGALLAFPLIAEPIWGARQIGLGWALLFVVLGLLLGWCAYFAYKGRSSIISVPAKKTNDAPPTWSTKMRWMFLAFIPSTLMLVVTTKISQDYGALPLIWVVPLGLYLLTFVITFRHGSFVGNRVQQWFVVVGITIFVGLLIKKTAVIHGTEVLLLIVAFFLLSLVAHRQLYDRRPGGAHLTGFYMIMSIGGALGGLFNSIVAPVLFNDFYEAHISALLSIGVLFLLGNRTSARGLTVDTLSALLVLSPFALASMDLGFGPTTTVKFVTAMFVVAFVGAHFLRHTLVVMPVVTLTVVAVFMQGDGSFKDRSFFGGHRITTAENVRVYFNGSTVHGAQLIEDYGAPRPRAQSYYHSATPMGQIFQSEFASASTDIGIVGLGVGALACYAQDQQVWQFYEIDAYVDRIARNPDFFTYMTQCAADAPTHLGDARIVLEQQKGARFDILVIDAYSSDAIPVHLTTAEAIRLFGDRLKPRGVLVLHITNRYYEIAPTLARAAAAVGMHARINRFSNDGEVMGALRSTVLIMSKDEQTVAAFSQDQGWQPIQSDGLPPWTDDYANVLSTLR